MATQTKLPEEDKPDIRPDLGLGALEESGAPNTNTGQHDDLGISPEQRKAEADNLERDYSSPSAPEAAGEKSTELDDAQSSKPGSASEPENQIGPGYNAQDSSFLTRARQAVSGTSGRQRALIGGGGMAALIITVFIIILSGFFSSIELINLRQQALGPGNGLVNRVLQDRRNKSFGVVLKKLSVGDFEGTINNPKMQATLGHYGFDTAFDGEGKLTHFSYTGSDGKTKVFNLKAPDFNAEATRFFDGDVGGEARGALKSALKYDASTWRGKAAIGLWQNMKVNFSNWLGRKPSDKATTPEEQLADDLRNADDVKTQGDISKTGEKPTSDIQDKDANGKPVGPTPYDATTGIDQATIAQYEQQLQNDPTIGDAQTTALGKATVNGAPSSIVDSADNIVSDAGVALDTTALKVGSTSEMESLLAKMAAKFPGIAAQGAAKGISATAWVQTACRVRGTLQFISNTRNVLLSLELARFAVKFMVAADNQKAGLLNSQGLNLLMLYMQRPNPADGRGYAQSGGIRYLMGDKTAQVSGANISRYSVGRANEGVLGQVSSFVDGVPLANNKTACRIVNNGLIQIGGFGIGAAFAIFGGGESGISEFVDGTTIGLTVAQELVFQVGTPLLIKTGAHMVFNGLENGEMVGDGLASGIGSLQGMDAGANGLRPATKTQAAVIQKEVNQDQKIAMAKQSIARRYFGRDNPNSLLAKMAVVFPASISSFMSSMVHYQSSLFAPSGLFGSLSRLMLPGQVKAATANNQCNDPQISTNNIATDPFCNPVMANTPDLDITQTETILKQNGQIDAQDNPVAGSDFANYISNCFSGRTGILYNPTPSQSGTDNPSDNTCVDPGTAYPGDTTGRNDRFANYYGYITDRDNMVQEVNGDFANNASL